MVDQGKVSNFVKFIDVFISVDKTEKSLDESAVDNYIQKAADVLKLECNDEELLSVKRSIQYKYQIYTMPGQSILADYEQKNWYSDRKADINPVFWTRYKNYLIDEKHFSPNVVSTLGEDTLDQKLMNYILDPLAQYESPAMKRGLIIGDVQSGKTSTYIGFMCKAADAGYKVFILLTGTIEALRRQTQERVEEGFIGIDMSSESKDGKRVGVGLDNLPIRAISMTSRAQDFTGNTDKTVISLASTTDAIVFVIKKNTKTLQKLTKWLIDINADPITKKINMPMLMIDDEADNASINTSADKEDPTKINKLIRGLASVFKVSNYVGFTATPFANVFIDPETTEKMETQDLFPEDFIVSLPVPSNYIGPNKIFAKDGEYHNQLIWIKDAGREEEDGFPFYFKHNKEWRGELPASLTDAIYAFYIVNTIRDLRGDNDEHRSMLVNISRFINVQKYIKEEVEAIHKNAYRAIKFNLSSDDESLQDPILSRIHWVWEKYYLDTEFSWEDIADNMFDSIENIQIKIVNSSRDSEKLVYPKDASLRVIAIGGLALSRGLTLEGLVISYFYRNTSTYDVLMQMGRWFGYRKNYEDLFRIWTHKTSADWYAEIAEATDKLKDDMSHMRELEQKPKDFGIRVRNNSADLRITAYNKMRNSIDEYEYPSYFGGIVETPYLCFNADVHINNFNEVCKLVKESVDSGKSFERQFPSIGKGRYIIQDIPKFRIIELISRLKISRFSSSFDVMQITDFLRNCTDSSIDLFDVAFMEGVQDDSSVLDISGRILYKVRRQNCIIDRDTDRLSLGRRGKLGGPNDGLAGIIDFNGRTAENIVATARESFKREYEARRGEKFEKDSFSSETWFRYIKDRKPLLLVYFLDVDGKDDDGDEQQKKQFDELRQRLGTTPVVGFALGLPFNEDATVLNATRYKANKIYNWFERDELDVGDKE
ncbi:MAG: Z1 domain-containing protein [Clostridia bacterium]|nr:Z1 domain-containing protein [Clostridia bacterium]